LTDNLYGVPDMPGLNKVLLNGAIFLMSSKQFIGPLTEKSKTIGEFAVVKEFLETQSL